VLGEEQNSYKFEVIRLVDLGLNEFVSWLVVQLLF